LRRGCQGPSSQTGKEAKINPWVAWAARRRQEEVNRQAGTPHYIIKKPLLSEKSTFGMNERSGTPSWSTVGEQDDIKAAVESALQGLRRRREHPGPQGQASVASATAP
jgi:hypothetical protein